MKTSKDETPTLNNPYLAGSSGRKEWNDRYANLASLARTWQLAFAATLFLALVQMAIIGKLALQSHVQPYVVETNHGTPIAMHPMAPLSNHDPLLINYALTQFILNAKTVVADRQAQKALLNKVYAYSANDTLNTLREFYSANNPYDIAADHTVSVRIINTLPLSANSVQITWEETLHDSSSQRTLTTTRWLAHLSYRFGEVNETFINDNPFGLYVTAITWSQSQ